MILILKLTLSHFLDLLMWTIVSERSIRLLGSKYKNHFNQLGEKRGNKIFPWLYVDLIKRNWTEEKN